eukprot:117981_1
MGQVCDYGPISQERKRNELLQRELNKTAMEEQHKKQRAISSDMKRVIDNQLAKEPELDIENIQGDILLGFNKPNQLLIAKKRNLMSKRGKLRPLQRLNIG